MKECGKCKWFKPNEIKINHVVGDCICPLPEGINENEVTRYKVADTSELDCEHWSRGLYTGGMNDE